MYALRMNCSGLPYFASNSCGRLGRNHFVGTVAHADQLDQAVPHRGKHFAFGLEIGVRHQRPISRDDACSGVGYFEQRPLRRDEAAGNDHICIARVASVARADPAAGVKVEYWIAVSTRQPAGHQNIGTGEVDVDVAVSVRLHQITILDRLVAEGHFLGPAVEGVIREGGLGMRLKGALPPARINLGAEPELGVFVRDDFSAGFAEGFVGAGTIRVPGRVEEHLDRLATRLIGDQLEQARRNARVRRHPP